MRITIGLLAVYAILVTTFWIKSQEGLDYRLSLERERYNLMFELYQEARWGK